MVKVQANEAIFLHSSWRAASTYVWAKFRQRLDTYCYFEPLNEHLFTATAKVIDGFRPWSFANHPALDAPYLEEFRPLIGPGGGIPGFPAHLTFGRYCAASDDSLPELEAYLADLARLLSLRTCRSWSKAFHASRKSNMAISTPRTAPACATPRCGQSLKAQCFPRPAAVLAAVRHWLLRPPKLRVMLFRPWLNLIPNSGMDTATISQQAPWPPSV